VTPVKETFGALSLFLPHPRRESLLALPIYRSTREGLAAACMLPLLSQPLAIPALLSRAPEQKCCTAGLGGVHLSLGRNG